MPDRNIENEGQKRLDQNKAPFLHDETIEIEVGDFDSDLDAFDFQDSSEFDFSADLNDSDSEFEEVPGSRTGTNVMTGGNRPADAEPSMTDNETVAVEPPSPDDEFEFDSDGVDLFDDSGFELEPQGHDGHNVPKVLEQNDPELEAEIHATEHEQDSSIEVVKATSKWLVEDEVGDTAFANDDSELEDHQPFEASDSSFSLECFDDNENDESSGGLQMESVSPDSVVPDDFDAEDFEDPIFQNEMDSSGIENIIRPEQMVASVTSQPRSARSNAAKATQAAGGDSGATAEMSETAATADRGQAAIENAEVREDGGSSFGTFFSRLFSWFKSKPQRKIPGNEPSQGIEPSEIANRDIVAAGEYSIGNVRGLPTPDGEDFEFSDASTVDMTTIPTEEVSLLDNDSNLDDPPVETDFNLDRPSSLAAPAAEVREFIDAISNEAIDLLADAVFDDEHALPESSERSSDSSDASIDSAMSVPGDGDDVRHVEQASSTGPENGSREWNATDTLYDPGLGKPATKPALELDFESTKSHDENVDAMADSSDLDFEDPDSELQNVSAADTIRERGDLPTDPVFEKERFLILQSQIDELERENKLLNKALLSSTVEAEKVGALSAQLDQIHEALEVANEKNLQLESKLELLQQDLAEARMTPTDDQTVQIEDLQNKLDALIEQNDSLENQLNAVQAKFSSQALEQLNDVESTDRQTENTEVKPPEGPLSSQAELASFVDSKHNSGAELDAKNQLTQSDPDFLNRFELRLKKEYKKRKQAERELEQAEEQRNELAKALRLARKELDDFKSDAATTTGRLVDENAQMELRLAEANQNHRQMETQITELQLELTRNQNELECVKNQVGDLVAERQQIDFKYRELLQHSELATESLSQQIDQLQEELATRKADSMAGPPEVNSHTGGGSSRKKREIGLTQIAGIGPVILKKLNSIGVTTLEEIAAWNESDVADVDARLNLRNRATREKWVQQAKELTSAK